MKRFLIAIFLITATPALAEFQMGATIKDANSRSMLALICLEDVLDVNECTSFRLNRELANPDSDVVMVDAIEGSSNLADIRSFDLYFHEHDQQKLKSGYQKVDDNLTPTEKVLLGWLYYPQAVFYDRTEGREVRRAQQKETILRKQKIDEAIDFMTDPHLSDEVHEVEDFNFLLRYLSARLKKSA